MTSEEARRIMEEEGCLDACKACAAAAPPLGEDAKAFLIASGFRPRRRELKESA